jgi:hypothetical protein
MACGTGARKFSAGAVLAGARTQSIATHRQATTDVRFAVITGGKADIPQGRVRAISGHAALLDHLVGKREQPVRQHRLLADFSGNSNDYRLLRI